MIKINLLKPGIMVYDTPESGGIIDIEKFETTRKIKPCLFEVVWDKEDFEKKMKEKLINNNKIKTKEIEK